VDYDPKLTLFENEAQDSTVPHAIPITALAVIGSRTWIVSAVPVLVLVVCVATLPTRARAGNLDSYLLGNQAAMTGDALLF
jgi:hypothetical protein